MTKKLLIVVVILLAGCSLIPTPDDFPPPPPMTPIVEWPQITPTVTLEPNLRPILPDNIQDAEIFFLIFKTALLAGDDAGVAEAVKYPIRVKLDGQIVVINDQAEFLDQYEKIFDPAFATTLSGIDESSLTLLANGVRVGNGELWFNSFCVDLSCSDAHFLITQINR